MTDKHHQGGDAADAIKIGRRGQRWWPVVARGGVEDAREEEECCSEEECAGSAGQRGREARGEVSAAGVAFDVRGGFLVEEGDGLLEAEGVGRVGVVVHRDGWGCSRRVVVRASQGPGDW